MDKKELMSMEWVLYAIGVGLLYFFLDGIFFRGYLRTKITIKNKMFDSTLISITYGNLFKQNGWLVIPVNEYFDNCVDNKHVSKNSLHGQMLKDFLMIMKNGIQE